MNNPAKNKELISNFWDDLYVHRDYDKCGEYFAEDGLYRDVPAPDHGAVGPKQISGRLKMGLAVIDKQVHHMHRMVAEGDTVITEHTEDWHFKTGEVVCLPFVSVQVINADGKIQSWSDYFDLNTLLGSAPKWWLDHIAQYTEGDFEKAQEGPSVAVNA